MGINGQFFSAIIPAAGSGDRLGASIPKALVVINGKTLIQRAVESITLIVSITSIPGTTA